MATKKWLLIFWIAFVFVPHARSQDEETIRNLFDGAIQIMGGDTFLNVKDMTSEGRSFFFNSGGESSPLIRTYYFKHANLELFEHACDALRATGLDVRKDYATTGEAALLERPLRQLQPLIVRTHILELQHDQVRTDSDPPTDNEVVKLVVDVSVIDAQGASRYQARHAIYGRLTWQEELDVLRMLGLRLGERLARDPAFLRAVEATTRGAS